jgi:plasmid stabilization system protein ParE
MRISLSSDAQSDFNVAIDWYIEELAFAAADDFADEFEHALSMLSGFPNIGVAGSHKTRIFTLQNFPYSLVYRIQPEYVRVIAVAHHSRRPGYWAGRR